MWQASQAVLPFLIAATVSGSVLSWHVPQVRGTPAGVLRRECSLASVLLWQEFESALQPADEGVGWSVSASKWGATAPPAKTLLA